MERNGGSRMRESADFKQVKKSIKEMLKKGMRNSIWYWGNIGFVTWYTNYHNTVKRYLEWQKPKDVKLVSGKRYLAKKTDKIDEEYPIFIARYINGHWYYSDSELVSYMDNVLIKEIEV